MWLCVQPMTGSCDGGLRIAGAAALAVELVNADKALLPSRQLRYSWVDSGCSPQKGLAALGELLQGESSIDAVIGPACSSACEVTSYLSGGQNIPQISYGCTSPTLSDKTKFPLVHVCVTMCMMYTSLSALRLPADCLPAVLVCYSSLFYVCSSRGR